MIAGKVFAAVGICLIAQACAPVPLSGVAPPATTPTSAICAAHGAADGAELLVIEAELGRRGVMQCADGYGGRSYVGQKTATTVGRKLYARSDRGTVAGVAAGTEAGDEKNCSDFSSAAEAQRFFLASGGPLRDPHRLDGDGDGNACEWGKTLRASAVKYKQKPVRATPPRGYTAYTPPRSYTAPRSYTRTCHTGPRGGRYYYSASGRKVYGC